MAKKYKTHIKDPGYHILLCGAWIQYGMQYINANTITQQPRAASLCKNCVRVFNSLVAGPKLK